MSDSHQFDFSFSRPGLLGFLLIFLMVAACGSGAEVEDESTTTEPAEDTSVETTSAEAGADETTSTQGDSGEPVWFFDHLSVGDCWDPVYDGAGEEDYSGTPDVRGCDEPHFYEVYGQWTSADREYPGEDALIDEANEQCGEAFSSYVGAEYSDAVALDSFVPKPDEDQWDAGARRMVCVAFYDYGRVDESFRGIGTDDPLPYDAPDNAPIPEEAETWNVGTTEDGDRAISMSRQADQAETVDRILQLANEAGWSVGNVTSGAKTVVIPLSDGEADYTFTVSALDEDAPNDLTLTFYYPPGPLPIYPEQ